MLQCDVVNIYMYKYTQFFGRQHTEPSLTKTFTHAIFLRKREREKEREKKKER